MIVDLRSDTVTKPSEGMLAAMMRAEVGDDVFGQDPTVNALQEKVAKMFGMEAALFCPSGTMTNQIAVKIQTQPLDEVICPELSHLHHYEVGGYAFHSGVSLKLIHGNGGFLRPIDIEESVNPDYDWLPVSRLVWVENTCNKGGGSYCSIADMKALRETCDKYKLKLHLDGARIFNALVELAAKPSELGTIFDTISVCLSKGLGTPVGSVLLGNKQAIRQARRVRKAMGGGMRQAGFLAAAGIYALDNNINRLKEDHKKAQILSEVIKDLPFIENVQPVKTNLIRFDFYKQTTAMRFVEKLAEQGIKAIPLGNRQIRFVTHLDITDDMLTRTIKVLKNINL